MKIWLLLLTLSGHLLFYFYKYYYKSPCLTLYVWNPYTFKYVSSWSEKLWPHQETDLITNNVERASSANLVFITDENSLHYNYSCLSFFCSAVLINEPTILCFCWGLFQGLQWINQENRHMGIFSSSIVGIFSTNTPLPKSMNE